MTIYVGSARIDENGHISGGSAGDQTGKEVSTQEYYLHSKGWYVNRPKSVDVADKIAQAMLDACNNNYIGYDQNGRYTALSQWRNTKSIKNIKTKCETDCSALVRLCILEATGKDVGDFSTSDEVSVLDGCGLFEKHASVTANTILYNGDVLTTKTKGHTVIVVKGNPRGVSVPETSAPKGNRNVAKGQEWLNEYYGDKIVRYCGARLVVDNSYGSKSRAAALAVWKDLVNRKYDTNLTPSNTNFGSSCKTAAKKAKLVVGADGTLPYLVQFILSGKGYYYGSMDGKFDDDLLNSVCKFQKAKGLTVDGVVGPNTWFKLFN